jgi:hypothetical protein
MAIPDEPRTPRGYRPPLPPKRETKTKPFSWQSVALALFALTLVFWCWQWLTYGWPAGSSLFVIPLLTLLTGPIFIRAARTEPRFDLAGIMACGLALRFLFSFYRYTHGLDAYTYDRAGNEIAHSLRNFNFGFDPGGEVPGTGGMKVIAGVVSVFTNENRVAKFLIFAWLGFLGCYFLYQAFVTALPNADHQRYALLIFFWPTLCFWPSSIGKDCWMLLTLGLASWGAARVLVRKPGGYTLLVGGLLLGSFVRPHVTLMALLAFTVALLVGRRTSTRPGVTPSSVAKIAGLVILIVVGGVLASRAADVLNVDDFSGSSIDTALTENVGRTAEGGSAFTPANPKQPIGYVQAAVTILFRPFPNEAHGSEQIVTSFEALFLLVLVVASWRRLLTIPLRLRDEPYVTYALVYLGVFFFAFGTMANFGILARQRSQAMPFVFVLLCVPPVIAKVKGGNNQKPALRTPPTR